MSGHIITIYKLANDRDQFEDLRESIACITDESRLQVLARLLC
jgi:L-lactate permease